MQKGAVEGYAGGSWQTVIGVGLPERMRLVGVGAVIVEHTLSGICGV